MAGATDPVEQIRVGIYSNRPKVFLDENGEFAGFRPGLKLEGNNA